ncbi:glycosyltransferase family 9 protein [Chitinophaga varians]|uniref:Glycosyltransferase family 9 protein n=1 Tax=Chitinophaga varians TaxID=2202339 RepID=A0A847RZT3_9BACT|nr:glycosyltransferase family 9 protein [Chitinophaga varians]NLR68663.1 glycosyltransferase family 9 protein [Chitinophaga varians]
MENRSSYRSVCILYDCGNEGDELGNILSTHFLIGPVLKALQAMFGDEMIFVGRKAIAEVIFSPVRFKKIVEMGVRIDSGVRRVDLQGILKEIQECDLIICLNTWIGGEGENLKMLLEHLSPQWSIGFYDFFKEKLAFNPDMHFCDMMFQCVALMDPSAAIADFVRGPEVPQRGREIVRQFVGTLKSEGGSILVVAPHATCQRKEIAYSVYPEALKKVLDNFDNLSIIVLSSEFRWPYSDAYKDRIVIFDHFTTEVTWSFVAHADYFLGPESDALHIADIYRIPSVGIFGKLSPVHFSGFRFAENYSLQSNDYAMQDITTEQISEALRQLIMKTL